MITDLYTIKLIADLYTRIGNAAPTTTTAGLVGDIMLIPDGKTFELTTIAGVTPNIDYTWVQDTRWDAKIGLMIGKAETDYALIQGRGFKIVDDETEYPDEANVIAAEMVCYLLSLGQYEGRGKDGESIADRSHTYEKKMSGYPFGIVGHIKRYVGAV